MEKSRAMGKPRIVCFGEVLWDVLPAKSMPGGAPMNVAVNLAKLGIDTYMISRVGEDQEGKELKDFLKDRKVNTSFISVDKKYQTGYVPIDNTNPEEVKYEIVHPVAWDNISWEDQFGAVLKESDMLVFSTLIARESTSKNALLKSFKYPCKKVYDINLRPPFTSSDLVLELIPYADLLKVNEEELAWLFSAFQLKGDFEECAMALIEKAGLEQLIITLGGKGAKVMIDHQVYVHPGYSVEVKDTIGSGDAFLAAYLAGIAGGKTVGEALDFACKLGAFVASQQGANPHYDTLMIEALNL